MLLGMVGNAGYDIMKAGVSSQFAGEPDDLTERIFNATDRAAKEFFKRHHDRFPRANDSFVARHDNLMAIGRSLNPSRPPLSADDFDPRGFNGAPDATKQELSEFVQLVEREAREDRFLALHYSHRDLMRTSTLTLQEVEKLSQTLHGMEGQVRTAQSPPEDPWADMQILGGPPGWRPQQGQIYSKLLANGHTARFMFHGQLLRYEHVFPDGASWYADSDVHGNVYAHKFLAYPMEEYRIVVPEELVLREMVEPLPGDLKRVTKILKWGKSVKYTVDADGRLKDYSFPTGVSVNHADRTLTVPFPQETKL
jgi:hypothetical protein